MSNATIETTPVEVEDALPFSEKTMEYLIRTASAEATPDEAYRKLIELTVEATQRKRKHAKSDELAKNFAIHNVALVERIVEHRTIIRNTLKKLNLAHGIPKELEWAWGSGAIYITGIYRPDRGGNPTNITPQIAAGTTEIGYNDSIHFDTVAYNQTLKASVPIRLLTGDPIQSAQYTRNLMKTHIAQQKNSDAKELRAKQKDAQEKLDKLNTQIEQEEARAAKSDEKKASKEKSRAARKEHSEKSVA